MGLFYKVTDKELLDRRNKLFLEKGIPALNSNGFIKSPLTDNYGRNNLKDFMYELSKLKSNSLLEKLSIYICRGDRYIQIYLNIFELVPKINTLEKLTGLDAVQYGIPPSNRNSMQLRADDYHFIPIITPLFYIRHKLSPYYTKNGYEKRIQELGVLIEKDMKNIDSFVKRWHELHTPIKTTWDGVKIED